MSLHWTQHLILVPVTADGLARAIGETHRQYTAFVNARQRWTGHLFRGRFSSVVLDEEHRSAPVCPDEHASEPGKGSWQRRNDQGRRVLNE